MINLVSRNGLPAVLCFVILGFLVAPARAQHVDLAPGRSGGSSEVGASIPGVMGNGVTGVFLHSGELFVQEADLVVPSRGMDFVLLRRYEAQAVYSGPLGWGWDCNYHRRLQEMPNGDIYYYNGLGRKELFKAVRAGGLATGAITEYKAPTGIFADLKKITDGTWALVFRGLYNESYDQYGRLIRMQDRNGNHMEFYYAASGLLSAIMDTMGRLYSFEYWPTEYGLNGDVAKKSNRLKSVTDFSGRVIEYGYDEETGDLASVQLGERVRRYSYLNPQTTDLRLMHNLAAITDPMNQVVLDVTYEGDKVVSERIGGSTVMISSGQTAMTTDGAGRVRTYAHDAAGHVAQLSEGSSTTSFQYNDDGLLTKITYPLGNSVEYIYDTNNKSRRSQADLLEVKAHADARGGQDLVSRHRYDPWSNQLVWTQDPKGHETSIGLDDNYNPETITAPEGAVTTFVRDRYGRVKTRTAMNKVTRHDYYPEASPSGDSSSTQSARSLDPAEGGYLMRVVADPGGDGIGKTFTYDQRANLRSETDSMGGRISYEDPTVFGEMRRVVLTGEDVNVTTLISYDLNGNVKTRTERGITETYMYNMVNQPLDIARCCGIGLEGPNQEQHFAFTYYGDFSLKTRTDPRGNIETFEYDPQGRLSKRTRSGHPRQEFVYDENGNPTTIVDGMAKSWVRRYDGHDRLKASVDPLGNEVTYTSDEDSNIARIQGPEGFTADFLHDGLDRLRQSTRSGGVQQDFDYDPRGALWHYTSPNRKSWTFESTTSGLFREAQDPVGNRSRQEYDARGFPRTVVETETGNRSLAHSLRYDILGRLRDQNDAIGRTWRQPVLDQNARPTVQFDPENGAAEVVYDGLGRVHVSIRHVDGLPPIKTTYWYDPNGNVTDIDDALGNRTHYEFDALDRLQYIRYADGKEEHYSYNDNDRVTLIEQPNGTTVGIAYLGNGLIESRTITGAGGVGGSTHEQFSYDGLGRLKVAMNNSTRVEFGYGAGGRVERETVTVGGTVYNVLSTHDADGNKTSLTYPSNKTVAITPDALGRISTIATSEGANIASYTYEGLGKVTVKQLGPLAEQGGGPAPVTMTGHFDDGRRPDSIEYTAADSTKLLGRSTNLWNLLDFKISEKKSEEGDRETAYSYDKAWRLTQVAEPARNTSFTIDAADSIKRIDETETGVTTSSDFATNNRHQVTTLDGRALTYEPNGNLASIEQPDGTVVRYFYDWRNQLVKVDDGVGSVVEFTYDALGRRIERTIATGGGTPVVTRYVSDGWRTIEERDGANQVTGRYVYGNGIDEPVEIERRDPGSGDLKRFIPMQDTNGSVLALADATGKLVERVKYSTYGRPTFIYDHEPPKVDQVRSVGGALRIRLSEIADDASARDAIQVKQDGISVGGSISFAENGRLATFTPSSAFAPGQAVSVQVTTALKDGSGNGLENDFTRTFTTTGLDQLIYDRVPPQIQRINLISGMIKVEFDEEIDPTSITNSLELREGQTVIAGTITQETERIVTLTPSSPLTTSIRYSLNVKTAIADLTAKPLAEESAEHFVRTGGDQVLYERQPENEHETSYVGNSTTFQGRDYDNETHLVSHRSRDLDPELGRFLQPDPAGYKDSLNTYQALGMNPINMVDPFGWATINLYIGFEMNERNQLMRRDRWNDTTMTVAIAYPGFDRLKAIAKTHGHTLNVHVAGEEGFNIESFKASVFAADTWTFYVGHSNIGSEGRFNGLSFRPPVHLDFPIQTTIPGSFMTLPVQTNNEYIGIFACDSWSFAPTLFPNARSLFTVQEGQGGPEEQGLNLFLALYATYDLIEYLATTQPVDIDRARQAAEEGLRRLKLREPDIVRVESRN